MAACPDREMEVRANFNDSKTAKIIQNIRRVLFSVYVNVGFGAVVADILMLLLLHRDPSVAVDVLL
jgi:hypothetical protein